VVCVECGTAPDETAAGWEVHIVDVNDDGRYELVAFCPCCARREFHTSDADCA
jgi:hypothetical protein